MTTVSHRKDFVSLARDRAKRLWEAYLELRSMQSEWQAQDYLNTLGDADDVFVGANEGITAAQIGAVIFDTPDAIKASVFDIGHATNITNVLP